MALAHAGYVREAFAAGALGYVLKEAADTEVVGPCAGSPRATSTSIRRSELDSPLPRRRSRRGIERDPLSGREREVLTLLALGHTNREVAQMLHVSVRTAETHRAHVMRKLRISTRAELVRYTLSAGLLVAS